MNDLKKQIYQIRQKIEQKECYIIQKSRLNPEKIKKLLKIFLIFYVQKMGEKSPFFDFPGLLNNTKISKTKKTKN